MSRGNLFPEPDPPAHAGHRREPAQSRRVECRAVGCTRLIDPDRLMCRQHWFAVPKPVRDRVWGSYQPGQGISDASPEYFRAAADAVESVARQEGRDPTNEFRRLYELYERTGPTPDPRAPPSGP